jgi:hypothetical protein
MGDHHADRPAPLALDADAVCPYARAPAVQVGVDDLEQLALVDRAAVQLEVDGHVGADRRRRLKRADVVGLRVDERGEGLDVGEVAQRLDAAGVGAGADRDERAGLAPDLADALRVVARRDRPLDQ